MVYDTTESIQESRDGKQMKTVSAKKVIYFAIHQSATINYYLCKTVIFAVANAFLYAKKYEIARLLFNHAFYGDGKKLFDNTLNKLIKKIKKII